VYLQVHLPCQETLVLLYLIQKTNIKGVIKISLSLSCK
jgi:hypothetical protein